MLDARQVVVAVLHDPSHWQPRVVQGGNIGHRRKGTFEHERAGTVLGGDRDGHGAAQRAADEDDIGGLDVQAFGKPFCAAQPSAMQPASLGSAFAVAVAAVVEDEDRGLEDVAQMGGQLADGCHVLAVAVAVQDGPRRIGCGTNQPWSFVPSAEVK